jgi:hypothetical protein
MGLWGLVSVSRCWQEGGGVTELVSKIALLAFLRGCVVAVIEEPNNRLVDDAHHSFLQVSSGTVQFRVTK